ncbi:GMC oxidoreductase [Agrobacterium sp. LMR679]|uniref:GMC oxidoreductase n=1 Tax=Agrobacterium sp. LMR679 TaxID=3014335 RepID=UPI0022B07AB4|nr:GMC oxidoreductase [Agrobacterium sp. LMR679]MCZ4072082.1 GMC oxidoreductase [Agrobacterium sp. LMR679]
MGKKEGKFVEDGRSYLISKPDKNGDLTPFASTYERIAGGTGNHWMGTCLRMTDSDFKLRSKYFKDFKEEKKIGLDWPADITYAELEKHYIFVEKLIGVAGDPGEQEKIKGSPESHEMKFEFPMKGIPKSYLDIHISNSLNGTDAQTNKPKALDGLPALVTSTPAGRNSAPYQNRRVCHGNTNCTPICPIQAKYDPTVALSQALETGHVDILYQHVVDYVIFDASFQKVQDLHLVTYDDVAVPARETEIPSTRQKRVSDFAKLNDKTIFVLAAHAIENAKIMLNSFREVSNTYVPTASDSLIGKYLMDHPVYLAWGLTKEGEQAFGYRGPLSTSGIETGRDGEFRKDRAAWRIEIGNEGWNWPADDPYQTAMDFIYGTNNNQLNPNTEILFGTDYVKKLNNLLTRQFRVAFLVEQDANKESYIELSKDKTDNLGIPRVEVHYHISEYAKKGFASARKAAEDLFKHMGATPYHETEIHLKKARDEDPLQFKYGNDKNEYKNFYHYQGAGHVCGTHIMGDEKEKDKSVVNSFQKCHSHDNLYLVGCGSMPSIGTQNPTLTMLAITDRTGDDIIGRLAPPKP